jgi:hypothetical protein
MSVPPKDTSRLRKLADPLISNPQGRDGTIENYRLKSESFM